MQHVTVFIYLPVPIMVSCRRFLGALLFRLAGESGIKYLGGIESSLYICHPRNEVGLCSVE